MNESIFRQIGACARYLDVDFDEQEIAQFATEQDLGEDQLQAVFQVFSHLKALKETRIVTTLLNSSRLPLSNPKSFDNFDFALFHGKQKEVLKSLPTLSALYAHKNLAFIGPQGVGKTHLAMAYGRACCQKGMKSYFLKATELNQKFSEARKYGREDTCINGLVRPSCLIIDEVGRCIFNKENTRMFFDVIDRRYNKEGPNTMIFTSNTGPDKWGEYFSEDSSLLCSLDRIFDSATVFYIKGNSYRGKGCETIALSAGDPLTVTKSINN